MRIAIFSSISAAVLLGAGLLVATPTRTQAAPIYNIGDSAVIGLTQSFDVGVTALKINSLDDAYSARFTAMEDVTVDQVKMHYVSIETGTTVNLSLQADDGSGHPSGTSLTSVNYSPTAAVNNAYISQTFDSPVALAAGTVYHLVVTPTVLPSEFRIYGSNQPFTTVRPFDQVQDPQMNSLTKVNGGAWTTANQDPYFVFADAQGHTIAAPSQAYSLASFGNTDTADTVEGSGTAAGERFVIQDTTIPTGSAVNINQIQVAARSYNMTYDLIYQLRDADGNILASATLPVADADRAWHTLTFDQSVELKEGIAYLLTTQIDQGGGFMNHHYGLAYMSTRQEDEGASWGGTTNYMVISAENEDWSSFTKYAGVLPGDLRFGLLGTVVPAPEPTTAALLLAGLGGLLILPRRRRSVSSC